LNRRGHFRARHFQLQPFDFADDEEVAKYGPQRIRAYVNERGGETSGLFDQNPNDDSGGQRGGVAEGG